MWVETPWTQPERAKVRAVVAIPPGRLADLVLLRTGPYGMSLGDPVAHVALQATATSRTALR